MQELQELIESDPTLYMYFHLMFSQVPKSPPYNRTPAGAPQVRDYRHMIKLINHILGTAPVFNLTGFVGFPINAIIDWPMGTPAGVAAFLDERVNAQFKKILNEWAVFLVSPASRYVLNSDPKHGWFGKAADSQMPGFVDDFVCDPAAPFYGFGSWDDFFTREFRPGVRPVASPNDDNVIVSACESAPYDIQRDVKGVNRFWLKGQPYSLRHIFDNHPVNEQFVGGTVYQAYLSAESYHRWHAPVSGRIVSVRNIDGSYYAQSPNVGFDPLSPNESQGFITETAARAVVTIDADNPRIGLMAFVSVGMAECSSNGLTVEPGQHVSKGDQIGMFHYGGSTHLLIFRPSVKVTFDLHGQEPGLEAHNIHVKDRVAVVG
jgi:phosphatidylserine decarboxylase